MDRLFAYIGNDANLVQCSVHQHGEALARQLNSEANGWGMGYEQESQFLLHKRPQPHNLGEDLMGLVGDLRTHAFTVHMQDPEGSHVAPADMQPFRFRSWLFAHTGTLGDYGERRDAMELPDFLARNVRGTSASELLFHRFLTHLKGEGVQLRQPIAPLGPSRLALARTLREAVEWHGSSEAGAPRFGAVLINGRNLYVASVGEPFHLYTVKGIRSCPICEGQPLFAGHRPKKIDHSHVRTVMLVSRRVEVEGDDGGVLVDDGEVVVASGDLTIQRTSIETLLTQ